MKFVKTLRLKKNIESYEENEHSDSEPETIDFCEFLLIIFFFLSNSIIFINSILLLGDEIETIINV